MVVRWAGSVPANALYLSVISIFELELGMLQVERRDPIQAQILRVWIEEKILPQFAAAPLCTCPIRVPSATPISQLQP